MTVRVTVRVTVEDACPGQLPDTTGAMRKLPPDDRMVARQLLATTENELGTYAEALAEFPIDSRKVYTGPLPQPGEWQAVDAAEAIARLAAERRVGMVN